VDAVVYLVPLGRNRYELYSEARDDEDAASPAAPRSGFVRQRIDRLRDRWRSAVHSARRADMPRDPSRAGIMARARDWLVSNLAETIAAQRTLWSLRHFTSVEMRYPDNLPESDAAARRLEILSRARRHHGLWLVVDSVLFIASGVFILVPGPNLLAYYFGLRIVVHFLSWRGAGRGLSGIEWGSRVEPALAELGTLATMPRESRAPRVEAIASALKLPRLAAYFDRCAV